MNNFYFYSAELETRQPNYLVCYCSGSDIDTNSFSNELVSQFKKHIFVRNLIIIAPSFNQENIISKLLVDSQVKSIKDKINSLQELNIHTCFINRDGGFTVDLYKDSETNKQPRLSDKQLDKVIEFGLYSLTKNRNLILEASPNFHFIKPSGKHTSKFLAVSNMLECSAEVSFIASCLLKFLPSQISKVYVDTSGIYSLAHEITKLENAFNNSSIIIPVDSFGSYGGIEEYLFSSDEKTLVIISASTSNHLYEKLKQNPLLEQATIVSVVMSHSNTKNNNVLLEFKNFQARFCKEYFQNFDSYDESECPLCLKEHSIPVALDKTRFVFEAPRTEMCLPFAIDSDNALRKLISLYKDLDVFKCLFDGIDGKSNPTPEYFIDVSKLAESSEEFKKSVDNAVLRHFPINADCIVYCRDKGAKELAEYISNKALQLGKQTHLFEAEFSGDYTPKNGIVVIAGSIQSGKALLNISRYLRKYRDLPITYIVGFAKYNSKPELDKLQKDLTFADGPCGHHTFHAIEKILLPINEQKKNSWRKELDVLKELLQKYSGDDRKVYLITERHSQLIKSSSNEVQGLGSDLFLNSPRGKKMILGKTFAFWDKVDNSEVFKHHATVYFTLSSVLQRLRTEKKKSGIIPLGEGYIIRQLDPLLFDRFNEGIIQASVLRAAKARELDYSASDSNSRIVGRAFKILCQLKI